MTQPTHSPAQVIYQLLLDASVVVSNNSTDWMGFVGIIPDDDTTPDRAVGVMPTPGKRQGRILSGTKEVIESHGVQVRVRSLDFPGGHTKSKAIADKLDATNRDVPVTIGGSVYKITSIVRGSVMHVGMDPDNRQRHNFTINMQVKLEED